jgi:creatinine amidohydrolase/Fe(II)-dependent formamide hydrolase-like protein
MHRFIRAVARAVALAGTLAVGLMVFPVANLAAQAPAAGSRSAGSGPLVEFEMMTWPEVKAAIEGGKTTALVYTGGTEQRGPQNVNGGHTLMGKATVKAIALKLGNAIALPVLPYTPNEANAALPGTIGLTSELLSAILERISQQAIKTGFTNVVIMGDHGGGQPNAYAVVARKLDSVYAPEGKHVYFCDQVYKTANAAFDDYLKSQNMPVSSHAGIPDTSEMLYLGLDLGWVRPDQIPTAVQDREHPNGIQGDGRPSTKELGRKIFEMKVDYAVKQIQSMLGQK